MSHLTLKAGSPSARVLANLLGATIPIVVHLRDGTLAHATFDATLTKCATGRKTGAVRFWWVPAECAP